MSLCFCSLGLICRTYYCSVFQQYDVLLSGLVYAIESLTPWLNNFSPMPLWGLWLSWRLFPSSWPYGCGSGLMPNSEFASSVVMPERQAHGFHMISTLWLGLSEALCGTRITKLGWDGFPCLMVLRTIPWLVGSTTWSEGTLANTNIGSHTSR